MALNDNTATCFILFIQYNTVVLYSCRFHRVTVFMFVTPAEYSCYRMLTM